MSRMSFLKKVFTSRLGTARYAINFAPLVPCVTRVRGLTSDEINAHSLYPLFFLLMLLNYIIIRPWTDFVTYLEVQPSNIRDAGIYAVASL